MSNNIGYTKTCVNQTPPWVEKDARYMSGNYPRKNDRFHHWKNLTDYRVSRYCVSHKMKSLLLSSCFNRSDLHIKYEV